MSLHIVQYRVQNRETVPKKAVGKGLSNCHDALVGCLDVQEDVRNLPKDCNVPSSKATRQSSEDCAALFQDHTGGKRPTRTHCAHPCRGPRPIVRVSFLFHSRFMADFQITAGLLKTLFRSSQQEVNGIVLAARCSRGFEKSVPTGASSNSWSVLSRAPTTLPSAMSRIAHMACYTQS